MTAPATAPLDPRTARDQFGRRLAFRLWVLSIAFWWVLGIPFSTAWWLLNDLQLKWVFICYGWEVPVIGWTGAALVPWWLWRRLSARLERGDPSAEVMLARFPRTVGTAIMVTSCAGYLLGAVQISLITALPPLETFKVVLQGPVFGALFGVAGGLLVDAEMQRLSNVMALPLQSQRPGRTLRRQVALVAITLVITVALPLIMLGLAREQSALERERGALLLEALEDGVRNNIPLPDLSSFGEHTVARVVDRATGIIKLGPDTGRSVDDLGLDHTGEIMTGRAGWLASRHERHRVVAHLPLALANDPGVVLLAVSPLSDYGGPLWSATALALAVLLGALLAAVPVANRLAAGVVDPLERIRESAGRMAEGELDLPPAVRPGLDELVQLGIAFDRMAERVRHDEAQLREAYHKLEGTQQHLLQAERLAAVGRMVSGVAHELNNPLQAILALTEEVLTSGDIPAEHRPSLETLHQQALRTRAIVKDLLAAGRAPTGSRERLDVTRVARDVVRGLRPTLQQLGASVTVDGHDDTRYIDGDRSALEQVLVNLVTNGAESAGAGGAVRVEVSGDAVCVEIAVEDSGPGIPPEVLPRIFEPFYTTKRDGSIRGTGLGLYVALGLVESLGGTIRAGIEVNGGGRFDVRLPLAPRPRTMTTPVPEPVPSVVEGRRALIVDDESSIRDVLRRWLHQRGWSVEEASNGEEALATLRAAPVNGFQLVLSDLRMPGMTGGELLTQLAAIRPDLIVNAIVMTGDSADPESAAFLARTTLPTLLKPFNFVELAALIDPV